MIIHHSQIEVIPGIQVGLTLKIQSTGFITIAKEKRKTISSPQQINKKPLTKSKTHP